MRVIVLGAGSQAKVVIDLIETAGGYTIAGCVEAGLDPSRVGSSVLGYPVLGTLDRLLEVATSCRAEAAALAIGDNRQRLLLLRAARSAGLALPALVHPAAVVSKHATLGAGSTICAQAFVGVLAKVGEACIVNTAAGVDHDCRLGDGVHVAVGARLAGNVTVGEGSTIGAGATVIPGLRIGAYATLGAGCCAVTDVPDGITVVGVPAKPRPPRTT